MQRVLEPEVMDTAEEAREYDAMDHTSVNRRFAEDLWHAWGPESRLTSLQVLDAGTGTGLIPIALLNLHAECQIVAVDASAEMLRLAAANVQYAGWSDRVTLQMQDCRQLNAKSAAFDIVMSNSLLHHIPEPLSVLEECWRVLRPGGLLFVRDLCRPASLAEVEALVQLYVGTGSHSQQQLFRQSLQAALTVAEIQELLGKIGIASTTTGMTSDRHWTIAARKAE